MKNPHSRNEGEDLNENRLLLSQPQNLMAVLLGVLATADMNPVVAAVGGFHDELVVIRVGLEPREPSFGKFLVGVRLIVIPIGISGLGDEDVGCFAKGVLAGVCASDLDVEDIAAVARADDDRLSCKGTQGFQDGLAELSQRWNELRGAGVVNTICLCGG